jgi:hypothetical protein
MFRAGLGVRRGLLLYFELWCWRTSFVYCCVVRGMVRFDMVILVSTCPGAHLRELQEVLSGVRLSFHICFTVQTPTCPKIRPWELDMLGT